MLTFSPACGTCSTTSSATNHERPAGPLRRDPPRRFRRRSATPEPHEAKQIASYELVLGGASAGMVEFHVATGAVSAPALTVADREVVEIADSCIAMLLAATVGPSSEIEEPAFEKPPGGNRSAGIVLVDELGRLTIREPANHFAGYEHSYAKGRVDPN